MTIPFNDILLIITFNEQSWIVLTNGSWQLVIDDYIVPDGVIQYTVQLKDISTDEGNIYVYINDGWLKVPNSVVRNVKQLENDTPNESQANSTTPLSQENNILNQGGDSYFFQTVDRTGSELIAKSGFDSTSQKSSLSSDYQSPTSSDNFAEISVKVVEECSPSGEIYDLVGDVNDVEDGNTVSVTVVDTLGNSVTFLTLVEGGIWQVLNANVSVLVDGQLIVTASTSDNSGNPATSVTGFIKDTLAKITIAIETGTDDVINNDEADTVKFSGTVTGVENGQVVEIIVTDIENNTLKFHALTIDGQWQILDADLRLLVDGPLNYSATVQDTNCNIAEASTIKDKDTQAVITISVETNVNTTDNIINAAEVSQVNILGTVSSVENNQSVILTVTDGNSTLTFSASVNEGYWLVSSADLSSLNDGTITFIATVSDLAGNTTEVSTTTDKDTQASIIVNIESGDDDFLIADEINPVIVSGTVENVDVGQLVTVILTSASGDTNTLFTNVNNDLTWSVALDISHYSDDVITALATIKDIAGNPASAIDSARIDTSDGISIFVNTAENTVDFIINAAEVSQINILGLVRNVEDGQTIDITVSDGITTLSFSTIVSGLSWKIADTNLSVMNDGPLTFTSVVSDLAGNETSATKVIQKDTNADITIAVETNDVTTDDIINAAESSTVDISGTVSNIENNQTVNLTVSDNVNTLTFSTTVIGGQWFVNDVDVSSLFDGPISYTAQVNDIAGNPADISIYKEKDTEASITVKIESGDDEFLIADEINPLIITGTVSNIESSQTVTIALSNTTGDSDIITTIVNTDLTWSASIDISNYNDGALTAIASANDLAGNEVDSNDTAWIDTTDGIVLFVNTFADTLDSIINNAEASQVELLGLVRNVEDGQTITVTVSDNATTLSFTTVVDGVKWSIPDTDLSSLNDGDLTFTAQVIDIAGNESSNNKIKVKDTQASITIDVKTNEDTDDNV
ncbi:MAG TPA: hypothetical protein DIS98_04955, partial [Colwellia sp.]|nr:hypothetical protein [Colwellia sp.]